MRPSPIPFAVPSKAPLTLSPTTKSPTACVNQVFPVSPSLPGKKGAAFTLRDIGRPGSWVENLPKVIALRPHWNYSWGPKQVDAQPADIEFVPMIWGTNNAALVQTVIRDVIVPQVQKGQTKRLLGFNEPDSTSQANMNVSKALEIWPTLESANVPLTSPSCVLPNVPWMTAFMTSAAESTCPRRRVDWIGVHWYGSSANFDTFVTRMTNTYNLYRRPLLVTEFSIANFTATTASDNKITKAQVLAFLKKALPWMEQQEWIAGYAWFSFNINGVAGPSSALFDLQGNLTATGRYYASVRKDNPQGDQSILPDP
jgi:Glycosyl hydrolase catalytic core